MPEYVPPVPTLKRLRIHLQEQLPGGSGAPAEIAEERLRFLCNEIDRLEQRLDFFNTTKADKKEPRRRPPDSPHHFRGTRD